MNSVFTAKLLQNLRNKKANKGFTLIELLVVVIIIGVLAAVALPNLLGQVAKGRQAEAKNILGTINRTQQAHRLEFGTFGQLGAYGVGDNPDLPGDNIGLDPLTLDDLDTVPGPDNALAVSIQPQYYFFSDGRNAPTTLAFTGEAPITWSFGAVAAGVVDGTIAEAYAQSILRYENDIFDYAAQVSQNTAGTFASIICEEDLINSTVEGGAGVPDGSAVVGGGILATQCDAGNVVNN